MKIEKVLDIFTQASYGTYVILKFLLKNRQSFIKVNQNICLLIKLLDFVI